MSGLAGLVMLLGYALAFWGLQDTKAHRSDAPPVASPSDICTFRGQQMPCGTLPNNGVGFYDAAGRPARQPAAQASAGSFQIGLGFLVMIGGLIPGVIAGNNLRRIKNAVTDYTYEQIQSGAGIGVRCPHCGFENQANNQFCGRCGRPLTP